MYKYYIQILILLTLISCSHTKSTINKTNDCFVNSESTIRANSSQYGYANDNYACIYNRVFKREDIALSRDLVTIKVNYSFEPEMVIDIISKDNSKIYVAKKLKNYFWSNDKSRNLYEEVNLFDNKALRLCERFETSKILIIDTIVNEEIINLLQVDKIKKLKSISKCFISNNAIVEHRDGNEIEIDYQNIGIAEFADDSYNSKEYNDLVKAIRLIEHEI